MKSCIDTRIDQSCPPPPVPSLENNDPRVSSCGQVETIKKKNFYNLCKGTNALVFQTLYSEDFDSDDSEEDVFKADKLIGYLNSIMKS